MKFVGMLNLILIVLMLSGCAARVNNPVLLPLPTQSPSAIVKDYQIQAGDSLEVKFFYNPELNELVVVRPDGRISLQLANEILVAGLTPAELTEQLRKRYAADIDKPEITVFVRTFTSQRIFVDGEVNRAGLVALSAPMTILQSISQAGGFKDTASPGDVIVVRRNNDNKLITIQADLSKALDNTDIAQDLVLLPNDIIFVPKSPIANVNVWIDQYIRRNIPIPFSYSLSGVQ
ncbi:MAG TPA: polysaccharide biosynthesis/export family protein [Negativicutes bacterium]|jgi:protein involved in polysaccharide export with SLBB domain